MLRYGLAALLALGGVGTSASAAVVMFDFSAASVAPGASIEVGDVLSKGGYVLTAIDRITRMRCVGDCFRLAGDGYAGVPSDGESFLQFSRPGLVLRAEGPAGQRLVVRGAEVFTPTPIRFASLVDDFGNGGAITPDAISGPLNKFGEVPLYSRRTEVIFQRFAANGPNNTIVDVAGGFRSLGFSAIVPEPAEWALLVGGFGLVGFAKRRSRRYTRQVG